MNWIACARMAITLSGEPSSCASPTDDRELLRLAQPPLQGDVLLRLADQLVPLLGHLPRQLVERRGELHHLAGRLVQAQPRHLAPLAQDADAAHDLGERRHQPAVQGQRDQHHDRQQQREQQQRLSLHRLEERVLQEHAALRHDQHARRGQDRQRDPVDLRVAAHPAAPLAGRQHADGDAPPQTGEDVAFRHVLAGQRVAIRVEQQGGEDLRVQDRVPEQLVQAGDPGSLAQRVVEPRLQRPAQRLRIPGDLLPEQLLALLVREYDGGQHDHRDRDDEDEHQPDGDAHQGGEPGCEAGAVAGRGRRKSGLCLRTRRGTRP
jgi:hypothetical protein